MKVVFDHTDVSTTAFTVTNHAKASVEFNNIPGAFQPLVHCGECLISQCEKVECTPQIIICASHLKTSMAIAQGICS